MENYLHEISYIAYVLIHFFKELAIERSLLNRVGCVVTWVTWVHGCMDCVGQIFTRVDWVTWVKIFFTWVIVFAWVKYIFVWVFECVQNLFLRFFLCGSAFLTRWDYFSILQPMNWAFVSWDSSQKILTKLCLTPLVFLNGLIEICKIDEIQWHFYD